MARPFLGSEAVAAGRLSEANLRTLAWRRVFRDVYVRYDVQLTHLVQCRAAALILPPDAVFSGASAAYLHGADVLGESAPIEVTVGRQVRQQPGMALRRAALGVGDVIERQGLRVTSLARTAFDLARGREPSDAVVALDALLTLGRLSLKDVAKYAGTRRSWPGTRQLAEVLALAATGAESPMESRLRLVLVRAGLPAPVLQHRVHSQSGSLVARLDLAAQVRAALRL